jgi:hypothetical protein
MNQCCWKVVNVHYECLSLVELKRDEINLGKHYNLNDKCLKINNQKQVKKRKK